MMKIIYLVASLFFLLPLNTQGNENTDKYKLAINRLDSALQTKNTAILEKSLSPDFSLSVSMWPTAKSYIDQILNRGELKSAKYLSKLNHTDEDGRTLVEVLFSTSNGEEKSIVAFDKMAEIVYVDLFDRLYGKFRTEKSKLVATIPFVFEVGKGMVIQIKINDCKQPLKFLFDSGANGIALVKTTADSIGLHLSGVSNASFVGGQSQVQMSNGNTVHLNEQLSLDNKKIDIFEKINHDIDGIIGLSIATSYITKVDFDKNVIELYNFGDYSPEEGFEPLSIRNPHNIILLPGIVNIAGREGVQGNFAFDTGAQYNFIGFSRFVRKNRLLLNGFKPERMASTTSMGRSSTVFEGNIEDFQLTEHIHFQNLPVTLQASMGTKGDENSTFPDGSIGIGLIRKFNFVIDLFRKKIYLEQRS